MSNLISIGSNRLTAEIDPLGAQLFSLKDAQHRDLLWNGDPAVWSGRAPLLFPIVGTLAGSAYRLSGQSFQLPRHGFARGSFFALLESTPSSATFSLLCSEATERLYPFRFELRMHYAISQASLSLHAAVRNLGEIQMPASFGYHPGFRWPLPYGRPKSEHYIDFADLEPEPIKRLTPAGLLSATAHPTPVVGGRLILDDELFREDVIIFDALRSRSMSYGAASGPRLQMSFDDASYLGIWTKPGAGFVCLEPWHGIADPEGFSGEFTEKPGVFLVAPGHERDVRMQIALLD
jgi:galactose mutarotase-like enzyme